MTKSKTKVEDVNTYPIASIKDRHISLETAKKYGVRTGVSESDGKTPTHHYYPYTKNGEVVGYKARLLEEKKFYAVGTVDYHCELFGQSVCRGGKKLWVTEGEADCMALYEVLKRGAEKSGYGSHEPNVVSVGGAGWAVDHLSNNKDFLDKFKEIILVFDQDSAGEEAVRNVSHLFPSVKYAEFSKKDPCDMVAAGKSDELYKAALFDSKQYIPSGFVEIDDIWEEATKLPEHGKPFPWPSLTKLTYGRRKGEGYYIGAGVKCGKSEWVNQLAQHVIQNESQKIALFKLEEQPAMTARRIAGKMMNKQFHIPDGDFTQEELKRGVESLKGKVVLYDAYYKSNWDMLKHAVRHAVVVEGCEDIVIDPVTRLTDGMNPSETETELRRFASEISQMANDLGFTYYVFCHLKAPDNGPPHEEGGRVHSNQFRGSRAMMEATHYMIGIERNKSTEVSEEERNTSQFVLLEDRVFGNVGKFPVFYNKETGSYLEPTQEF